MQTAETNNAKTRRIAKNTLLLYVRTFITMLISLYTSRVILEALGIDDYGVYNVVGGIVGLLGIISGPLINAVTRFLTYYLGKGDIPLLKKVFASCFLVQAGLSLLVVVICETVGLWFLNFKLNIPADRIYAANWVFQFSIIGSVFSLLIIPYNAAIVSHERMGIYAYFSIIEVVVKLAFVYLLTIVTYDRLIFYALFLLFLSILMQLLNLFYCKKHFEECHVSLVIDKPLLREISAFAGWNFLGNAANVCNSQGINILLNMFFGVAVNAARAIVSQIENAIKQFVTNFMVAVNPQITKTFTQGDFDYLKSLMTMSAKYSFFLFMLLGLPVWIESEEILTLWLKKVPEDTSIFLRLSMIVSAITIIGDCSYNFMMATGNIKKYQILASVSGLMVLPLTWLLYKMGFSAHYCYFLLIINYGFIVCLRLYLLQRYIQSLLKWFIVTSVIPIFKVLAMTTIPTYLVIYFLSESILRLMVTVGCTTIFGITAIYFLGFTCRERTWIKRFIRARIPFKNRS